jgi:hypothetical protein
MKTNLLLITACAALLVPKINVGQVNLGSTSDYVLFTSSGAVGNTGISHITGNIGTNVGAITAFGNVDGTLNAANAASSVCVTDLTTAYNQLLAMPATTNHVAVIATGEILTAGVYTIAAAGSAVGTFSLDAQSNANAQFVFRFGGAFTTAAATEVYLMNGAKACNVFWIAEGAIAIGANTTMKGTVISHNAAISMAAGGKLEGRLFSTAGAVSIDGALVYLPLGCGSPILTGPTSPNLASTACYALFSANGAVTNTATTMVTGDVGTNVGLTSGFTATNVIGTIHPSPDASTGTCASDLLNVYSYLNTLTPNTELLYPAQLGNKLVLTPHTYTLNAATMLTDTLFLNAQNNANAVFAILINGALTTSSNAKVILQNGALAKNVFWLVNGNVNISTNSNFIGTVVSNGAIDLATGVKLDGRALTTVGSVTSNSVTVVKPSSCVTTDVQSLNIANSNQAVSIYPNPFSTSLCINLHNAAHINTSEFLLYDVVGEMVLSKVLTKQVNMVETCDLPSGVYFYKVLSENKTIQSGRLISQQ